jgi:hypothetical protein
MRYLRNAMSFLAIIGALQAAVPAQADEENIPLDKLPRAVVDAVKDKFPDAKLVAAEKETRDGKVFYEVMLKNKDLSIEMLLTPEGKIVVIEQPIPARELPKAVRKAIDDSFPKATVKSVEETTREDKKTYGVLLENDQMIGKEKQKVQLQLTSEGKVIASQKLIGAKDLPKAVTEALEKKYSGAEIMRANERTQDGKVSYLVILETADKKLMAILDREGKILKDFSQDKKDKK